MSAAEALKAARAVGTRVGIDGDDLVLEASARPACAVLDLLSRHKADIVTLLQGQGGQGQEGQVPVRLHGNVEASSVRSDIPTANGKPRVASREAYVSPTRGAQGDALKTLLAMPFALDGERGETAIESRGIAHRIRFSVDPSKPLLRSLPREDRDIFISANNSHVLAFNNISALPAWLSDALCCLATGGGYATRSLYSNGEEQIFDAMPPIILNGTRDFVGRPDLADRSLFLTLEQIPDASRRAEEEFWEAFEAARPRILGALLDVVAHGIDRLPRIRLGKTSTHGGFREVGGRLRDRVLASPHLHECL
jgi:hypothetical protein